MSDTATLHSGSKRPFPGTSAAAAERRLRPRHFHHGPNPTVNNGASSGVTGSSRIPLLHRHALESIFAFFTRSDLVTSLCVSKEWLTAVKSMASLQLKITSSSAALRVVPIVTSVMRHHFTEIGDTGTRCVSLDEMSLFVLADRMSHVKSMHCNLLLPLEGPLYFPASLRTLTIRVSAPAVAIGINAMLTAISHLSHLETLHITIPFIMDISFAPLVALSRLRNLDIYWRAGVFTDAHVDQLRTLSHLQKVSISHMTTDTILRRVLHQPHNLQWKELSSFSLNDVTAALLGQLPSLTTLTCVVDCSDFDWLQRLTNLTDVDIEYTPHVACPADSLVAGLQCCTKITALKLARFTDLTSSHLAELLPQLPKLHVLTLNSLNIDSLSFISQHPIMQRLSVLDLTQCTQLPLIELHHVHHLRGLTGLILIQSFNESMDSYCQSLLTPPSVILRELTTFIYAAPAPHMVEVAEDAEPHMAEAVVFFEEEEEEEWPEVEGEEEEAEISDDDDGWVAAAVEADNDAYLDDAEEDLDEGDDLDADNPDEAHENPDQVEGVSDASSMEDGQEDEGDVISIYLTTSVP